MRKIELRKIEKFPKKFSRKKFKTLKITVHFSPLSSPHLSYLRSASCESPLDPVGSVLPSSSAYTPNDVSLKLDDDFVNNFDGMIEIYGLEKLYFQEPLKNLKPSGTERSRE